LEHAGEEHLDPAYVVTYDRKAAVDPASDLALLRSQGLSATSTLVDLGDGTFALAAAPFCQRVIAVAVLPAMLVALRMKAEQAGAANVEYVQAGFLSTSTPAPPPISSPHATRCTICQTSGKALALQRIAGILRPGGVLRLRDLVFSFEAEQAPTATAAWLAAAASTPEVGWTRDELPQKWAERPRLQARR
jgi:hypothetical protein